MLFVGREELIVVVNLTHAHRHERRIKYQMIYRWRANLENGRYKDG